MRKTLKTIISAKMARFLIRQKELGKYLVDICPHDENKSRSIFVFEYSDEVRKGMNDYHKSIEK